MLTQYCAVPFALGVSRQMHINHPPKYEYLPRLLISSMSHSVSSHTDTISYVGQLSNGASLSIDYIYDIMQTHQQLTTSFLWSSNSAAHIS